MIGKEKDLLDKSSEVNRNLGLFFVGFLFYLFLTTSGISDFQLVMQSYGVALPFLSITIPLREFAWIVPVIIIGVHLNLLLNLLEHTVKFKDWLKAEAAKLTAGNESHHLITQKHMHPFLFNYTLIRSKGVALLITKFIVNFFTFCMPLFVLSYIQYRFSDTHEIGLVFYHFSVFLLDALVVIYFYRKFFFSFPKKKAGLSQPGTDEKTPGKSEMEDEPPLFGRGWQNFSNGLQNQLNHHFTAIIEWTKKILPNIRTFFYTQIFKKKYSVNTFLDLGIFIFLTLNALSNIIIISLLNNNRKYKIIIAYQKGEDWKTMYTLYTDSSAMNEYNPTFIPGQSTVVRKFPSIPTISIHGEKIALYTPNLQEIFLARQMSNNEDSLFIQYTKGISLEDKDFKLSDFESCEFINSHMKNSVLMFSNLRNCKMTRADLTGTELTSANMANSDLREVSFKKSNLQWANLENSIIQRADLSYSKLNKANLNHANLSGANLSHCNLNAAYLGYCELSETDFSYVSAIGASLEHAIVQRATLSNANFNKTDFSYSVLDASDFSNDTIMGAKLISSNMEASNLFNVNFQGSDLTSSNIKCSNLNFAKLQASNMTDADISGCIIIGAFIKNAIWKNVHSYGLIFHNPDTITPPSQFSLFQNFFNENIEDASPLAESITESDESVQKKDSLMQQFDEEIYDATMSIYQNSLSEYTAPPVSSIDAFMKIRIELLKNKAVPVRKLILKITDFPMLDFGTFVEKSNRELKKECELHIKDRLPELD